MHFKSYSAEFCSNEAFMLASSSKHWLWHTCIIHLDFVCLCSTDGSNESVALHFTCPRHIHDIAIHLQGPQLVYSRDTLFLSGLPDKMKELCKNLPVHRVKAFETNGEEEVPVEAVQRYLNSQLLPKRFKRYIAQECDLTVPELQICQKIRRIGCVIQRCK